MTVYVDDMRAKFRRMVMCHMIADTDEELHTMAAVIGVRRQWWQGPPEHKYSHYDICLAMRKKAVLAGAVQISWRKCSTMCLRRAVTGELGQPSDSLQWLKKFHEAERERRNASAREIRSGKASTRNGGIARWHNPEASSSLVPGDS